MSLGWLPLLIALLVVAFLVFKMKAKAATSDYVPPPPMTLRTDLLFGYFHTFDSQAAETADHVNVMFESGWFGAEATALSMRSHGKRTILCLSVECYDWAAGAMLPRPDARERVMSTLRTLDKKGVLGQVLALYPIDEPDLSRQPDEAVLAMCALVRSAGREFPALATVKLAVIYANRNTLPGIAAFDWVGLDDYPQREGLLASDLWVNMLAALHGDQRVILVPGGADPFRQDPEAFRRYAHANPQVVAILAFMWAQQHPGTLAGIGTNGMADKYRALGRELVGPSP